MSARTKLAFFQTGLILLCAIGAWQISESISPEEESGSFSVTDTNGRTHYFDE